MTDPTEGEADLGEIVVIGRRPVAGEPKIPEQIEVDPDPNQTGGGDVWRPAQVGPENARQQECAAKEFEKRLDRDEQERKDEKEFFSLIWVKNGETVTHSPRGGTSDRITGAEIQRAMQDFGISGADIVGYTHNHPSGEYCTSSGAMGFDEERVNAYPSENDWNAVDALVPADSRSRTTLYILGCDNQMRSFPYAERAQAERAGDQRERPPEPIAPEDCAS